MPEFLLLGHAIATFLHVAGNFIIPTHRVGLVPSYLPAGGPASNSIPDVGSGTPTGQNLSVPGSPGGPDLGTFVNNLSQTLFDLGIVLCVIGLIIGGITRATAFGNERRIVTSNVALSCAVLGFLVILLAQPLANALAVAFNTITF